MDVQEWSKSSVDYGRKVLSSGLDGARSGREAFLHGTSVGPFLRESSRDTWRPTLVGACIGALASIPGRHSKPVTRIFVWSLLGAAVGLGAGIAWKSRSLTVSVAESALKSIGQTRDEHWLERHPIDYA